MNTMLHTLFLLIFIGLGLSISIADLRWRLAPDRHTQPLLLLGFLSSALGYTVTPLNSALGALVGYILFTITGYGYKSLRGTTGLGGGDVKLMAALGSWVGVEGCLWTISIGSLAALFVSVVFPWGQDKRIPFAPFLISAHMAYFFQSMIKGTVAF